MKKTPDQLINDFQTPIPVCKYMASLIPDGTITVLEPTKGIGNIVKQLDGYVVTAPDNYFDLDKNLRFDCVIMNPPFSGNSLLHIPDGWVKLDKNGNSGMKAGYQILTECMRKSDNIIALMPWFTLSDSDVRLRALKSFGMISVTALPRKTFEYARIQTVVIQLQKGFKGETKFNVFDLMFNSGTEYHDLEKLELFQ